MSMDDGLHEQVRSYKTRVRELEVKNAKLEAENLALRGVMEAAKRMFETDYFETQAVASLIAAVEAAEKLKGA